MPYSTPLHSAPLPSLQMRCMYQDYVTCPCNLSQHIYKSVKQVLTLISFQKLNCHATTLHLQIARKLKQKVKSFSLFQPLKQKIQHKRARGVVLESTFQRLHYLHFIHSSATSYITPPTTRPWLPGWMKRVVVSR